MKFALGGTAAAVLMLGCTPAAAADRYRIDIPAGPLDRSIEMLSRQTGIAIGGVETGMAPVPARAVRGRLTLRRALDRMLAGTDLGYSIVSSRAVRITRPPRSWRLQARRAPTPQEQRAFAAAPAPEIIVITGSKQRTSVADYPGTAHVLRLEDNGLASESLGLEKTLARLPTTTSTNLGPGRNKLFIRGIADSSFNGPTQSTVGIYLGDVRLIYSAPNPDLRLYDVDRVEVIEGPQGTLYGAGSLGGIVRIVPNAPQLDGFHARAWGGAAMTAKGDGSHDLAGMVNVPVAGFAALRLVGYRQREGGYIDDTARGLENVNDASIDGWRATARVDSGGGWTVDLAAATQILETSDSQYAERGRPALTRASALAQPYDMDVELFSATITKDWGNLELVSATGLVRNDIDTRFDATLLSPEGTPTAFEEDRAIDLFSHETRLSLNIPAGPSAVVGVSYVTSKDEIIRSLGAPDDAAEIGSALDKTREIALFGEGSLPLFARLTATAGARLVHTRVAGERESDEGPEIEPTREQLKILPTAALSRALWREGLLYLRYQRGFRPGGISIGDGSEPEIARFRPDSLDTVEAGLRHGADLAGSLSASATLFYTRWRNIQSDLIDPRGFPRTANIGDGIVYGLTAGLSWRPLPLLRLDGALFLNHSELTDPAPDFPIGDESRLPNVPRLSARGAVLLEMPVTGAIEFKARSQLAYLGESNLGIGPFLAREQGGYVKVDAGASFGNGRWSVGAEVTNLLDIRGNRFSLGNPFSVAATRQITPERPRTVRLSVTFGF